MMLITRLAKLVHRSSSEQLLGMRLRQFYVLSSIGCNPAPSQQELGERTSIDANNVVLLLNELEAAGFVQRRRDPSDRRRHLIELTRKGEQAIARAERAQESLEDEVLVGLSAGERAQLRELLQKALDGRDAMIAAGNRDLRAELAS